MAEWVRRGERGQWRRWKERELEELEDLGIWGFGEVAGEELRREEGGNWRGWRRVNEPCWSRSTFAGEKEGVTAEQGERLKTGCSKGEE